MKGLGVRHMLGAAMAMMLGRTHAPEFVADLGPTIRNSPHRTSSGTRRGRSMTSRRWYASMHNRYASSTNGERECARRRRQIAAGKIGCPVHPA